MLHLVWTVLIGFISGFMARAIFPGEHKAGFIVTTLLGIAGSFVAGYVGQWAGFYQQGDKVGFIMSVIGAIAVLWVHHFLKLQQAKRSTTLSE